MDIQVAQHSRKIHSENKEEATFLSSMIKK